MFGYKFFDHNIIHCIKFSSFDDEIFDFVFQFFNG